MRHLNAGRKLNRNASHRLALMRNLALALFRHERIITTVAKAKEARPFVEKLITLAREDTLHNRRQVLRRLGMPAKAEVRPATKPDDDQADHRPIITKLFTEIGPRYRDRPGGYTRVIKRAERRLGDGGQTAYLELVRQGESRARTHRAAAPAPRVSTPPEQPAPAPAPTPPPPEQPRAEEPRPETPPEQPNPPAQQS